MLYSFPVKGLSASRLCALSRALIGEDSFIPALSSVFQVRPARFSVCVLFSLHGTFLKRKPLVETNELRLRPRSPAGRLGLRDSQVTYLSVDLSSYFNATRPLAFETQSTYPGAEWPHP